ncbi:MAG: hypothetical protein IJB26_01660 [Clostridia bacterium]|nr:hypothetical protein [Clostridia bacterium]
MDKMELAKQVYNTLCAAIENRGWTYDKKEEKLSVYFGVNGDDIPMQFVLFVDADRQLVTLLSPLPFEMSEDKRMEGAIAVCAASYGLCDGGFDYDLSNGRIVFRMTASFRESVIGEGLFQYMISCACNTVDEYNDKLLAVNKGVVSIADFLAQEYN